MKKYFALIVLAVSVLYLGSKLRPQKFYEPYDAGKMSASRVVSPFDLAGFGRLPVLLNGRLKPLDTVARSSLLLFQGRQTVTTPAGLTINPMEWLLDVLYNSKVADTYQVFEIVHPELLGLFDLSPDAGAGGKRFSFAQLGPKLTELTRQYKLAEPVEAAVRTSFQRATIQLYGALSSYHRLKYTLAMAESDDFLSELRRFEKLLPAGVAAVQAKQAGQPHDEATLTAILDLGQRYDFMASTTNILAVPPDNPTNNPERWQSVGQTLLSSFQSGTINSTVLAYAGLGYAWRQHQAPEFNKLLSLYRATLEKPFGPRLVKVEAEVQFNAIGPFYASMTLYVAAFLLAIVSWLKWPQELSRAAFYLVALAWLATTAGIITRMWLEGRPPVTNLYSSALFVGWGSVGLCLFLEAIYKNAIGSVAAGLIGFATLLIAHHLSLSGDTLEMMRAVLDSNFWLATHVVIVATGYAATFLAGFLAIIYIVRGQFTRSLDKATGDALSRMVYGVVCFATLFSFVGTVLGGIWADQSWGRFWGWDPKENGALIIVLWNALILHARWGGLVKTRGLMALAVFGNIVTSWSWFGTNMLGVGLHSYGFTDAAFVALSAFVASQLLLIGLALRPVENWLSFKKAA
jgi:ABC-type transport system involved in cytochrome c biogenesis permease subunit